MNGQYIYGNFTSVITVTPGLPDPSNAAAYKYSSTQVKIIWNSVHGANGYEVWRSTSSTGTFTCQKTLSSTSYINSGLAAGTKYYYKIRAYSTVGGSKIYSAFSSLVSAIPS